MFDIIKTVADTTGNATKLAQLEAAWSQTLNEVLRRGYYGTAAIEVVIQDGVIQQLKRRTERIER